MQLKPLKIAIVYKEMKERPDENLNLNDACTWQCPELHPL
jgi:hypothetical protein